MKSKKTLFIAEDHRILRDGLKLILSSMKDLEIIGESGDGREALDKVLELKPDLLLLDISMPSMLGLDVAEVVFKKQKDCKIIVLTKHDNVEYLKKMLKYKIAGYVLKEEAATDLVKAIESALNQKFYISPKIAERLKMIGTQSLEETESKSSSKAFNLTPREKEIVKLIAEDKTTIEIAKILFISPKTIKVHRSNIFKKLNITSVTELVKYAVVNGLIDLL